MLLIVPLEEFNAGPSRVLLVGPLEEIHAWALKVLLVDPLEELHVGAYVDAPDRSPTFEGAPGWSPG